MITNSCSITRKGVRHIFRSTRDISVATKNLSPCACLMVFTCIHLMYSVMILHHLSNKQKHCTILMKQTGYCQKVRYCFSRLFLKIRDNLGSFGKSLKLTARARKIRYLVRHNLILGVHVTNSLDHSLYTYTQYWVLIISKFVKLSELHFQAYLYCNIIQA